MSDSDSSPPKVLGTLRRLLATLLALLENRLQLFAVECRTEKCRLVELIVLTALAACFGVMAVVFFAVTVVLLAPEEYRVHVVAGVCALSALGALGTAARLRHRLKHPPPFTETVAQLKKDRAWITPRN